MSMHDGCCNLLLANNNDSGCQAVLANATNLLDIRAFEHMGRPVWSYGMYAYAKRAMHANVWQHNCCETCPQQSKPGIHVISCHTATFPTEFSAHSVQQVYQTATHVYAQNLDRSKLNAKQNAMTTALPLGLDLHAVSSSSRWGVKQTVPREQYKLLCKLRSTSQHAAARIRKVLVTWLPTSTTSDRFASQNYKSRPKLYNDCIANPNCAVGTGNRDETWKAMSQHAFVYSPIGVGFDCHRTWEALALGCIVIAQRNPALEAIFGDHPDLPIWFCDEPYTIDLQLLDKLVNTLKPVQLDQLCMPKFVLHAHTMS
jgi:hypothetical protein